MADLTFSNSKKSKLNLKCFSSNINTKCDIIENNKENNITLCHSGTDTLPKTGDTIYINIQGTYNLFTNNNAYLGYFKKTGDIEKKLYSFKTDNKGICLVYYC